MLMPGVHAWLHRGSEHAGRWAPIGVEAGIEPPDAEQTRVERRSGWPR